MINIRDIINDHLQGGFTRNQLVSALREKFPNQKKDVNLAIIVFDSDIVTSISSYKTISPSQLRILINYLVDNYGLQEEAALLGIEIWALAFDTTIEGSNTPTRKESSKKAIVTTEDSSNYDIKDLGDNTAVIMKFKGFDEEYTIVPNTINGTKIIGIGEGAYQKCSSIITLEISEGIEFIENAAFADCKSLKKIILPESLKRIGSTERNNHNTYSQITGAFEWDTQIEYISLPKGIKEINEHTFFGCSSLKGIKLPEGLTVIESSAFFGCENLYDIRFPSTLKVIGSSAFYNCKKMLDVELPDGLIEIGFSAFKLCDNLKKILIPNTVIKIGEKASDKSYSFLISKMTAYCYSGSYGLEYARNKGLKIENACNYPRN